MLIRKKTEAAPPPGIATPLEAKTARFYVYIIDTHMEIGYVLG